MPYLLDTCTLSDYIKGDVATVARLKAEKPRDIYFSAITRFEIEYGLQLKPSLIAKISPQLNEIYQRTQTIAFSASEAETTATIRGVLKNSGQPIGFYDLLIAGTAATHDLILVTSNVKEFSQVPALTIDNWR
ncbi:MAG: PIN domain-containing protein [Cyanobacteria bacterium J06621_12]